MWVRKRIDIGWSDLMVAAIGCFRFHTRPSAAQLVESIWSKDGLAVSCLSVRSGLDLVLSALQLPAGSEVLVSAITIPDMVRILTHHGLVPIPIDLQPGNMSPQLELLEKVVTNSTKAILVAHLFGGRFDLTPIAQFAKQHGLMLLEDCAQAFEGNRYHGHDGADVSMFSFGPIKTATALGGGILRIQDQSLRNAVRELQSKYPIQSRWTFFRRVLSYCGLKWLGGRIAFKWFCRICTLLGKDLDKILNGAVRNFSQSDLLKQLQQQPSTPLLLLMARRIARFRTLELDRRASLGKLLTDLLPDDACPGSRATSHSFWAFPLYAHNQPKVVASLRSAGFDATAESSLRIVEHPNNRPETDPKMSKSLLASVIYVPVYPAMPEAEIHRLASLLITAGSGRGVDETEMAAAAVVKVVDNSVRARSGLHVG